MPRAPHRVHFPPNLLEEARNRQASLIARMASGMPEPEFQVGTNWLEQTGPIMGPDTAAMIDLASTAPNPLLDTAGQFDFGNPIPPDSAYQGAGVENGMTHTAANPLYGVEQGMTHEEAVGDPLYGGASPLLKPTPPSAEGIDASGLGLDPEGMTPVPAAVAATQPARDNSTLFGLIGNDPSSPLTGDQRLGFGLLALSEGLGYLTGDPNVDMRRPMQMRERAVRANQEAKKRAGTRAFLENLRKSGNPATVKRLEEIGAFAAMENNPALADKLVSEHIESIYAPPPKPADQWDTISFDPTTGRGIQRNRVTGKMAAFGTGGSSVNVNMGDRNKLDIYKPGYQAINEAAATAARREQQINQLDSLLDQIETGPVQELTLGARKVFEELSGVDMFNASAQQAFQAVKQGMAFDAKPVMGQVSNFEQQLLGLLVPQLGNTKRGNEIIIAGLKYRNAIEAKAAELLDKDLNGPVENLKSPASYTRQAADEVGGFLRLDGEPAEFSELLDVKVVSVKGELQMWANVRNEDGSTELKRMTYYGE